ncbi:MAG: alpha/beta hydrolase [Pseudomonadota bacterium]
MTAETRAFWDAQLEMAVVVPGADEWIDKYGELGRVHGRLDEARRIATGPDAMQSLWHTDTGALDKAMVLIHGGYWRRFSAAEYAFGLPTAAAANVTFFNVDYRLMPGVRMADVVSDTLAACEKALEMVPNAVLVGHSAGAHLALETAMRLSRPPRAVVAMSGLFELAPLRHAFIREDIALSADEVAEFSPIERVADIPAPVHVQVGADETLEFQRQSVRLYDTLVDAGQEATFWFAPGQNHFQIAAEMADPQTPTASRIVDVLVG